MITSGDHAFQLPPDAEVLNVPIRRHSARAHEDGWKYVIVLWDASLPKHGVIPLELWQSTWLKHGRGKSFASKYYQRKAIALEFMNQ